MSQQIELTAEQLSALDQVIVQKKEGRADFIGGIVNSAVHVTPVITATVQVTQAIGAAALADPTVKALADVVNHASVDDLIELRKHAIKKS